MAKSNSTSDKPAIVIVRSAEAERAESVSLLIENEALLPMRSAVGTLSWLESLAKTIHETASAPIEARSDHRAATHALRRIASLSQMASYLAADFANLLDCAREDLEKDHLPAIIMTVEQAGQQVRV